MSWFVLVDYWNLTDTICLSQRHGKDAYIVIHVTKNCTASLLINLNQILSFVLILFVRHNGGWYCNTFNFLLVWQFDNTHETPPIWHKQLTIFLKLLNKNPVSSLKHLIKYEINLINYYSWNIKEQNLKHTWATEVWHVTSLSSIEVPALY